MELELQRYIIQCFWMKDWGAKSIKSEMKEKFKDNALSATEIKFCFARFKENYLSCEDQSRPGRLSINLGPAL
jgi:hypothetical protein